MTWSWNEQGKLGSSFWGNWRAEFIHSVWWISFPVCPAQDLWILELSYYIYWSPGSYSRVVSSASAKEFWVQVKLTGKGSSLKIIPIIHSSVCCQYQGDKEAGKEDRMLCEMPLFRGWQVASILVALNAFFLKIFFSLMKPYESCAWGRLMKNHQRHNTLKLI